MVPSNEFGRWNVRTHLHICPSVSFGTGKSFRRAARRSEQGRIIHEGKMKSLCICVLARDIELLGKWMLAEMVRHHDQANYELEPSVKCARDSVVCKIYAASIPPK